jgi:hypothetical protein
LRKGNFIYNHLKGPAHPEIETADTVHFRITDNFLIASLLKDGHPFLIMETKKIIGSVKTKFGCFKITSSDYCKEL